MIFGIETSCDETAAAVVEGRKVLANVIYSQAVHSRWGGVVPSLARKEHQEKLPSVIAAALQKLERNHRAGLEDISAFAVTYGPGLAIALETGIEQAKTLSREYGKPLVPVNHLEGHIYSVFVQNSRGNPAREFEFPYLVLIISGGHTELVVFKDHFSYKIIGKTLDDAAGEALDKAAKMLGLGYPGGPVLERLAEKAGNKDFFDLPRTMIKHHTLDFSFSGLKTALYYMLRKKDKEFIAENLERLASSFQNAVFDSVLFKLEKAIQQTGISNLIIAGGVSANRFLRRKIRFLARKYKGKALFPPFDYLTGDNAAMIAVAGYFRFSAGFFLKGSQIDSLERVPRLSLEDNTVFKKAKK